MLSYKKIEEKISKNIKNSLLSTPVDLYKIAKNKSITIKRKKTWKIPCRVFL